jgi:hypothetical protein
MRRRRSRGRTATEAERPTGQRLSVVRGADAVADLRARLADRDGVATTIYRAEATQQRTLVQSYWMLRWTGPTHHVILTPTKGHPVMVEMFLPETTSELVLASRAEGKMMTHPYVLAAWLGLQDASRPARQGP